MRKTGVRLSKILVAFDPRLVKLLEEIAKERMCSRNEVIRAAVYEYASKQMRVIKNGRK
jgi:metal-responsive CopG/Arc/MetJ family transcriptional regulator